VAALLAYNVATTGSATLSGYEMLWGASHGLGFHQAPWGVTHTPARGLELANLYFLRLQTFLFETPLPSLVPAIAALALVPRLSRLIDTYASSAMLVLVLCAWHDRFFRARFFYLLLLPWSGRRDYRRLCAAGFPAGADRALLTFAVRRVVAMSVPDRATVRRPTSCATIV
jgi:hypothetical protein